LQIKSLDALSKLREARLAFMNDKIMEQKYMEVQEQLERLKMKEADLLEQQNVLNDKIAENETLQEQLEEQKKAQVDRFTSIRDCFIMLPSATRDCFIMSPSAFRFTVFTGLARAANR
jgi:hypothetical protein